MKNYKIWNKWFWLIVLLLIIGSTWGIATKKSIDTLSRCATPNIKSTLDTSIKINDSIKQDSFNSTQVTKEKTIKANSSPTLMVEIDSSTLNNNSQEDYSKLDLASIKRNKIDNQSVSELTLFVNSLNNIIATYGVVLCLITILLALVGFISFKSFEDKIKEFKKSIEKQNKIIDGALKSFSDKQKIYDENVKSMELLRKTIEIQSTFINKSNNYIYSSITSLAQKTNNITIIQREFIQRHIVNLYSLNKEERYAALQYFSENATKDHYDDILYVSINDREKELQDFAIKIIGRIEERNGTAL